MSEEGIDGEEWKELEGLRGFSMWNVLLGKGGRTGKIEK